MADRGDERAQHGGQVFAHARHLGMDPGAIQDFSASINPLGPPAGLREVLVHALDEIRFYPDGLHVEVKEAIGGYHRVESSEVFCGNGASEVIDLVFRALAPKHVILLEPAFSEYRVAAGRIGATVESLILEPDIWDIPWEALEHRAHAGDLVVLNNPHNPTGRSFARDGYLGAFEHLLDRGVFVLADESFMDFVPDADRFSALPLALRFPPRVVVVRSATKFYTIPGLRFGYGVASADLVSRIEQQRDRWSVNHLAQKAFGALIRDEAFREATWQWLRAQQVEVQRLWSQVAGCRIFPTSVNFFLLRWADASRSRRLAERLLSRGVVVRLADDFRGLGPEFWRVAIRTSQENQSLHASVRELERGGIR